MRKQRSNINKLTGMADPDAGAYPWKHSYSCSDGYACMADRIGSPALPARSVTGTMAGQNTGSTRAAQEVRAMQQAQGLVS